MNRPLVGEVLRHRTILQHGVTEERAIDAAYKRTQQAANIKEIRDLKGDQLSAVTAWFFGGDHIVTSYSSRPDDVSFGKYECERVPFRQFWLGLMQDVGWFEISVVKTGIAVGMRGQPTYTDYEIRLTQAGRDAWQRYCDPNVRPVA